jgi:hypothetical protein
MFGRVSCCCRCHPSCGRGVQRGSERGLTRLSFALASLLEPRGQLPCPLTQRRRLQPGFLGAEVGVGRAQLHPSSAAVTVVIYGPYLAAGWKHAEPEVGERRINVFDHRSAGRAAETGDGRFNQVYFHQLTSLRPRGGLPILIGAAPAIFRGRVTIPKDARPSSIPARPPAPSAARGWRRRGATCRGLDCPRKVSAA